MYEGIFQRSPVKQMVVSETPTRWSVDDTTPMPTHLMAAPTPLNFPSYHLPPTFSATASWNDDHQLPESWSQTFMEGLVNEDDKLALQEKDFEINWNRHFVGLSPKSKQGHSYECNYSGGVAKKAKIQHSSAKTIIKVRKEKLGDRITALHRLVSPFGKTDTATVLLETDIATVLLEVIGYIKFLEKQIEALSVPYMVRGGSGRIMKQRHLECDEETKKDLRSRGLCPVPLNLYTSCWE